MEREGCRPGEKIKYLLTTEHNEYLETYANTLLQNPIEASQDHLNSNGSDIAPLFWDDDYDPESPSNWSVRQNWTLTAFTTFPAMMNGIFITVSHFEISKHFHINKNTFPNSYWPVSTWATGGVYSALCILPLAEDFGTRPIFLSTYILFLCILVPQALAQNFATLSRHPLPCRRLSIPVCLYILGYMSWSSTGPVIGAVIFHSLRWRWISYMQLIWFRALFPNGDESSGHEASGAVSSRLNLQSLIVSATRPVIMFSTETYPLRLVNFLSRKLYFASASRNTEVPGTPIPEARLYMAVVGGVFGLSGGMFVYAWTSYSSLPWIAPTIWLTFVGAGSVCVLTGVSDYVVDFYSQFSGSAMGAVAAGENVFSAFLPLATMSMYRVLEYQWACTLLGFFFFFFFFFFCLVLSLIPTLMFVLGKEVRARSAFMDEMANDARKKRSQMV
ncbi:uncharacterized protein BO87DRAFT_394838 [Aspergillus neoniger CBS 115656]|uniref:MFS general substrate transporter n=1 Tax=Aspergillus neoniger (strain CBS 115656) TaxID=1448310 RepID=A0A318ZAA5_ASPNB|nr:hypothetical protein BO87DRAFT_394838 [Aspergillus neoniger CBS 115656]PYH37218.1 hypothetical protein BO87DRAFT_394838 [Aspergillus neoniger CBS 115656]